MILVCGEALYDFFLADGDREGVLALDGRPGGSPFNVAVGLTRLGQPVGFLSALSTDVFGERLTRVLRREGVSGAYLRRSPAPSTLSIVGSGPAGRPCYSFRGEGAADRMLAVGDLPPDLPGVTAIHFGSLATVAQPVGAALRMLASRETRARLIAYDPNVRATVEPDAEVWRGVVSNLAAVSHLLKISAEDLAYLYPGAAPHERAAAWLKVGVRLVVLTDGEAGASAWTRRAHAKRPAERIAVADTVGAGDTFQAALLAGLAETGALSPPALADLDEPALSRLLDFSVRAAAITCSRRGADLPRRAELPALQPL